MTLRSQIQAQLLDIEHLIQMSGDHPLMGPSLKAREVDLKKELVELSEGQKTPRATLYFYGQPVFGSLGIDAEFSINVLNPLLDMVKIQHAVSNYGKVRSTGTIKGKTDARLMITGLPRGSFGFELSQLDSDELFSNLSEDLSRLTGIIRSMSESDEEFGMAMDESSPRLIKKLREFFEVVHTNHAHFRIVSGDLDYSLSELQVKRAYDRINGLAYVDEKVEYKGILRGLLQESGRFEFRLNSGKLITGRVSDEVTVEQMEHMSKSMNSESTATVIETRITSRIGYEKTRYELISLLNLP